jgi:hypothetical protein
MEIIYENSVSAQQVCLKNVKVVKHDGRYQAFNEDFPLFLRCKVEMGTAVDNEMCEKLLISQDDEKMLENVYATCRPNFQSKSGTTFVREGVNYYDKYFNSAGNGDTVDIFALLKNGQRVELILKPYIPLQTEWLPFNRGDRPMYKILMAYLPDYVSAQGKMQEEVSYIYETIGKNETSNRPCWVIDD